MSRSSRVLVLSLLCLCVLSVASASAQTPLDPMFLNLKNSTVLIGAVLIIIGTIILGLVMIGMLHLGPQGIMVLVFGILGLFVIGTAINGQMLAWMGVAM